MKSLIVVAATLLSLTPSIHADELFNNFGPNDGYTTGIASSVTGWGYPPPAPAAVGFRFAPSADGRIMDYQLPLGTGGTTNNQLRLELRLDVANRPDFTATGLVDVALIDFDSASIYSGTSQNQPLISTSQHYWLLASMEGEHVGLWYVGAPVQALLDTYIYKDRDNPDNGFFSPAGSSEDSVFRINGVSAVPEPATIMMILVPAVGAIGIAWRRRLQLIRAANENLN